jgi:hypothetical protein
MARLARRSLRIKDLPIFSLSQSFRDLADTERLGADGWGLGFGIDRIEIDRGGRFGNRWVVKGIWGAIKFRIGWWDCWGGAKGNQTVDPSPEISPRTMYAACKSPHHNLHQPYQAIISKQDEQDATICTLLTSASTFPSASFRLVENKSPSK